ncbi:TetR/AcrR family transcriptional regulator [Lacticaseibacillus saniviri]
MATNQNNAKRQHILDIANQLFSKRGYKATRVTDIAQAANVSQVTIFKYFTSKEQLAHEVVMALTTDGYQEYTALLNRTDLSFEEKVRIMINHSSQTAQTMHPNFIAFMVDDYQGKHGNQESFKAYQEGQAAFWHKLIQQGRTAGQIRPEVSDAAVMQVIDMLVDYVSRRPQSEDMKQTIAFSTDLSDILFHGLLRA